MEKGKIDPIALEILSHKIWQITDEMARVLERTSGSPVVYDVRDYMTAIYDTEGNAVMVGCGVVFHGAATVDAVKYIIETYKEDPGINDGDVFFANDPYISACHQPDVTIITPIFFGSEVVAWAASMCHIADTGGIDPGGFCTRACEVYQEGFRSPGIKIVENNKIKKDVWDTILNMVRDPGGVGLDLKAMIATGETAKSRIFEMIEQYGVDSFKLLCEEIINYSETKLRGKISQLPNGTWRSVEFLDDGKKLLLSMTKKDDSLVFDFTGTDDQSINNRNSSLSATRGAVFGALAPLLCYDIPWSQGILNVMDTIVPEGTILNPKKPAALTEGPIGPAFLAHDAAVITISTMLNSSDEWKEEATASWNPSVSTQAFAALNQHNHFIVTIFMDIQGGGGGATPCSDGVDTGGMLWIPTTTMPNVETYELILPILYLFRRQTKDSGGPGKFRGGVGGEYAIVLHDSPSGEAVMPPYGCIGGEAAIGLGLSGGYPTLVKQYKLVTDSNISHLLKSWNIPEYVEDLDGDVSLLSQSDVWHLHNDQVFYQNWFGGGGYGDPLEREPKLVLKDVLNELVSEECAELIYGVIIDNKTKLINDEKTKLKRINIIKDRLSKQNKYTN